MAFRIDWQIEPEGWRSWRAQIQAHAAGDDFDRRWMAISWSPSGRLQMESDGQLLFLPQLSLWWILTRTREYRESIGLAQLEPGQALPGPPITIFKLVSGLEEILASSFATSNEGRSIERIADEETSTILEFEERHGYVRISYKKTVFEPSSDHGLRIHYVADEHSCPLVVEAMEFRAEALRFISEFAQALITKIPELRSWETWKPFERFVK